MKAPHFLSDRPGRRGDIQLVSGMDRADPGHVCMGPSKHIDIELYNLA